MGPKLKRVSVAPSKGKIPTPRSKVAKMKTVGVGPEPVVKLELNAAVVEENTSSTIEGHLSQMNRKGLMEICKKLNVKAKGKNHEIITKLLEKSDLQKFLNLPVRGIDSLPLTKKDNNELQKDLKKASEVLEDPKDGKVKTKGGRFSRLPQPISKSVQEQTTEELNNAKGLCVLNSSNLINLPSTPENLQHNDTFTMANNKETDDQRLQRLSYTVTASTPTDSNNNRENIRPQGWCVIENCFKKIHLHKLILQSGRVLISLSENQHVPLLLKSSGCTPADQEDNLICEECVQRNEVSRNRPKISPSYAAYSTKRDSIYTPKEDNEYARKIERILDSTLRGSEEERRLLFFGNGSKIAKSPAIKVPEESDQKEAKLTMPAPSIR